MRDGAQRVNAAVAEALVVARLPMSMAVASRMRSTRFGDSFMSPSLPRWPYSLTMSAATPAAWGEAMEVPLMHP